MPINGVMFEKDHNEAYFQGRNGMGHCRGVDIWLGTANLVLIEPINSKGNVANCTITFPVGKLDEVIAAMEKIRDEIKTKKKGK